MAQKRCFLFGAGERCRLRTMPEPGELIVAADGGQYFCSEIGVQPNLLVGDFDSSQRPELACEVIELPVEKDETDTLHAVRLGLEQGCREFHIYGGTGGRLDHTLANLQTLLYIARHGGRGFLYDTNMTITVIENAGLTIYGAHGLLSVFCLGDRAQGVYLRGVYYPLENAVLTPDYPLGVSNQAIADPVEIRVDQGALAVLWED